MSEKGRFKAKHNVAACNTLAQNPCDSRADCKYIAYGEGDAARAYCRKVPVAQERRKIVHYKRRQPDGPGVRRSAIAYTYDGNGKVTNQNRIDPVLTPCNKLADNVKHCHYKVMLDGKAVHYIGTRAEVFNGTALMTGGGLLQKDIHVVSKDVKVKDGVETRRHYPSVAETAQADRLQDWSAAVLQARKNLKLKGFVALSKTQSDLEGNSTLDGYRLYNEAKKIYKDVYGKSVRAAPVRRRRVVDEPPGTPERQASRKATPAVGFVEKPRSVRLTEAQRLARDNVAIAAPVPAPRKPVVTVTAAAAAAGPVITMTAAGAGAAADASVCTRKVLFIDGETHITERDKVMFAEFAKMGYSREQRGGRTGSFADLRKFIREASVTAAETFCSSGGKGFHGDVLLQEMTDKTSYTVKGLPVTYRHKIVMVCYNRYNKPLGVLLYSFDRPTGVIRLHSICANQTNVAAGVRPKGVGRELLGDLIKVADFIKEDINIVAIESAVQFYVRMGFHVYNQAKWANDQEFRYYMKRVARK